MKTSKFVLFSVMAAVAFLSFGCAHRADPNWRPSARVDFVNSTPGAHVRVRDNYDNTWSPFVPYGQSVWVPLHMSYYSVIASATVEVVANGRSSMLPYQNSWSTGQGGIFYANVLVQGGGRGPSVSLVASTAY
ncbi:MAG TPA: hypothetical protein VFQ72_02105 [Candidatus Paceibacterota bacterium]|nr:hypothetical protein [Candidatus Paceibacterota bacterium]